MKRRLTTVGVVLLALGMALMVFRGIRNDPNAPRFVRMTPNPIGGFRLLFYGDNNGFQNDEMWLYTRGKTTDQTNFLFNLKSEKIVGELINGTAIAFNRDESKLLCQRWESAETPLMRKASPWIRRISFGKINLQNTNIANMVWLLDLREHTAQRISRTESPINQTLTEWNAAPGGRFVYRSGHALTNLSGFVDGFQLFDFETGRMRKIQLKGQLYNWRDEHQILIKDEANNLILFDALTEKTKVLFDQEAILKFSREVGEANFPLYAFTMPNETNGNLYLYFARFGDGGLLARTSPASTNLTVVVFHCAMYVGWSATLDPTLSYNLYGGPFAEPYTPGRSGVFLHSLSNDDIVPLVPAQAGVTIDSQEFYHNRVVYMRDEEIWRVDTNGSNNVRLFPPREK